MNNDAPVATVGIGPSEIAAYVVAIASLLNGTLGHDYGLSKNAQALSVLVAGLLIMVSNISRAIKHHAAMAANAVAFKAQVESQTALALAPAPPQPAPVAEAVAEEPKPPALAPAGSRAKRVQRVRAKS